MALLQRRNLTVNLADLQAAGSTTGADFYIGLPLPIGSLYLGSQVIVSVALAGPGLVSAQAVVFSPSTDFVADLLVADTYSTGKRQMFLSISITGCYMNQLTDGQVEAIVYFDLVAKDPYRLPPV